MNRLAAETRAQIFEYFQDNVSALKNAGSTCREWRADTQSLLFRNLTVELESLNNLGGDGGTLRMIGSLVRHLTFRSALPDSHDSFPVYLDDITNSFIPSQSLWHHIFEPALSMFPYLESLCLKDARFRFRSDMYRAIRHIASNCNSLKISNCDYGLHSDDEEVEEDVDNEDDDAVAEVIASDIWRSFAIENVTFEDGTWKHDNHTSGAHLSWLTSMPWRSKVQSLRLTLGWAGSDVELCSTLASWLRDPTCTITSLVLTLIDNIHWPSPMSSDKAIFSVTVKHLMIDCTQWSSRIDYMSSDSPLNFLSDAELPALEELELKYRVNGADDINDDEAKTRSHPARLKDFPNLRSVKVCLTECQREDQDPLLKFDIYTDFLMDCQEKGILQVDHDDDQAKSVLFLLWR